MTYPRRTPANIGLFAPTKIIQKLFDARRNLAQSVSVMKNQPIKTLLLTSIVAPSFKGRAVYLPIDLAGGIPHCFVSVRVAIATGATGFRRCRVSGTYCATWPQNLFAE